MKKLFTLLSILILSMSSLSAQEKEPTVLDTLDTQDKFTKILLYSDQTWDYLELDKPVIDTAGFFDEWTSESLHAFKGRPLSEIPEEVDLLLSDETHPYALPYIKKVRSGYKMRRGRPHNGVDLPLQIGDTIRTAFDGIVRFIGRPRETGGYGNLVIVRHANGLETYYGHLSKICVSPDEMVKAGECIGLGGSSGRSTGPHLHFETRYMGQSFDPERIFDFENGTIRDTMITLHKHYYSIWSHYGQSNAESKAASGRVIHKVRSGENLGVIARKYGTTVNQICRLNGISSKKVLRVGQSLIVR